MSDPNVQHQRLYLNRTGENRRDPAAFLRDFDTSTVPTGPGCYIMVDEKGKPIYVGKAKNLRARIRTYINESDSRYSVKFLMRRVAHIEFIVVSNEKEALLLENSLIKEYKPRYNVRLKDDKTYLSLRIDPRQKFPRITVVRRYKRDGAKYFGPYHSANSARQTVRQIHRMFPLRTCTDHVLNNRTRPCLYYQMNRCVAPCVDYVSNEQYAELVEQVIMTLEGRNDELERRLKARIKEHAEKLEFEEAAVLRDRLHDLHLTLERQAAVTSTGAENRDVFGYYTKGRFTEIQALFYRNGKMLGGRSWSFERTEMPPEELISSLLMQYYTECPDIPREVLLPVALEEADALSDVLTDQRAEHVPAHLGTRVHVHAPQRGDKRRLVDLANKNAQHSFEDKQLADKARADTLEQVQKTLKLPSLPKRIECFDISTMQGNRTVASMVVFTEGQADKQRYRRYSIKGVEGQDDFASMREVLMRRYTRAIDEDDLPDFVLIDGGKGQLNVATAVFKDLGIEDLPHAGIAKSRAKEDARSPERFFLPGRMNPVVPPQNGPVVHLLARIRDEAHRFAITYHRKKRSKATLRTALVDIPGVGPERARRLLNAFGSVARIREASVGDVAAVKGFSETLARQVQEHLSGEGGGVSSG
jgi:excinuclease ABC subunit C